jgi:hypothetical protein
MLAEVQWQVQHQNADDLLTTVQDVVSYKVKELTPHLELEPIGLPTGLCLPSQRAI